MPRRPGESQLPLDFQAQIDIPPKSEDVSPQDDQIFRATPEQAEASKLRTFHNYLKNLDIKPEDLKNKDILDVGASSGAFGDIAVRFGARVISIDEAKPKYDEDVLVGDSKKLFSLSAEDMQLAERLGQSQEPKFDLIFSHYSTPYVFVNDLQDKTGKWKTKSSPSDWRLEMAARVHTALENICKHLKIKGKAVLYPLFLHLDNEEEIAVDFGNGEKRDVREFNAVVHEILRDLSYEYEKKIDFNIEPVSQKDGSVLTRLTFNRLT